MQDSGQGNGRNKKGQFAPGASGNPNGRRGKGAEHPAVRMDSAGPEFGSLPGEHIDPERVLSTIRMDGWQNASTGMGVQGYDKRLGSKFVSSIVSYNDLVELWRGDDICARIIETLPNEALQKGYELTITDEGDYGDLKDQVEQAVDELEMNDQLRTALMYERAYGGGALLIGANDGQDMSMPLNLDGIYDLQYVTPLEPYEITPLSSYTDQMHPKYGKPELYQLNAISQASAGMADPMSRCLPSTSVIHETRLIIFPGIRVSKFQSRSSVSGVYWGDSVLNRCIQVIADFNMGFASTGIILTEQGLPIFHMKELAKLVNANRMDIVKARLSLLFQQMSTARAAVIDSEENYERKAMPLNGISDILDRLCTRLAAAVPMPVTKLMGQSPKGLGNEGDSDMEQWYDQVASYQDGKIRRPLRRLLQIVMRARGLAEPPKWSIDFHPLVQQSDKEQAEARQVQMTIDTGYIAAGVLTVDEVRDSRFTGKYSHETQLNQEAWNALQAANGPMSPEDMMAMGLDPNNPDDVAQAQAQAAGGMSGMDPSAPGASPFGAQGPGGQPEVDPETGEPIDPMAQGDAPPDEMPPPEGAAPGGKPAPFGAKPTGAKPVPGDKPADGEILPFGKAKPQPAAPAPGDDPHAAPDDGEDKPKGKVLPFGKKANPAKPGQAPDVDETHPDDQKPTEGHDNPDDSRFANSESESGHDPAEPGQAPAKPHAGGRSGETDQDRQRMASQRPGIPNHLRDVDGDGEVSKEEAAMSIDDLLAAIEQLKKSFGTGMVPGETLEQEAQLKELAGEGEEPVDGEEPDESGMNEGDEPVEEEAPADDDEEEAARKKPRPFGRKDADWDEDAHPRDESGKFSSSGGGSSKVATPKTAPSHEAAEDEGEYWNFSNPDGPQEARKPTKNIEGFHDDPPPGYVRLYRGVNPMRERDSTSGHWYASSYSDAVNYANMGHDEQEDYEERGELIPGAAILAVDVPEGRIREFVDEGSRTAVDDDTLAEIFNNNGERSNGGGVELYVDRDTAMAAVTIEGNEEDGERGKPEGDTDASPRDEDGGFKDKRPRR